VLLFLGQLRYIVNSALKVKSIQIAGGGLNDIQALFPKLSQAALTHQIKKAEELSFEQLKQLSSYVFEKELELKSDFAQPQGVFLDLILKIRQLNFIKIS